MMCLEAEIQQLTNQQNDEKSKFDLYKQNKYATPVNAECLLAKLLGVSMLDTIGCSVPKSVGVSSETQSSGIFSNTGTCSSESSSRSYSPLVQHFTQTVMYADRDILDLFGNICDPRWQLKPSELPAKNLKMFWENRSQYHRLSPYGEYEMFLEMECPVSSCHFKTVQF